MLGIYVHTHWGYNHPYAARTWMLVDWQNYLEGLAGLGYDFVVVWPQLDCMPPEPNASDHAFLETIAQMINLAHERFGMRVAVTACANAIGNDKAASYVFQNRPYFVCEKKVNPKDKVEVEAFLRDRLNQFRPLRKADAIAIIDSDPGGYINSTKEEFVELMKGQSEVFRSLNPSVELIYWMLTGWESYNHFWAETQKDESGQTNMWTNWKGEDFVETLTLLQQRITEPWSLFSCFPKHKEAIESLDLRNKALWFPYGLVEAEPSFPLTNCNINALSNMLVPESLQAYPRGVIANAQTHCMQLPHTYMFAHFAKGGTRETVDLAGFAEDVLQGLGQTVAEGWLALEEGDAGTQRAAAENIRTAIGRKHTNGKLSGLLFGDSDRFLADLASNLDLRAALIDLKAAIEAGCELLPRTLRRVFDILVTYQQRLGFVDAYGGPLYDELNSKLACLGDTKLDAVLKLFNDWRNPSVRNGIVLRLLDAMDEYCRKKGV